MWSSGQQHAGDGHLAAADMGVRVDGAGHHHAALHVVGLSATRRRLGAHDLAILDIDVADLAAHFVGGVVDLAAGKLDHHGDGDSGLYSAASIEPSTSAARGSSRPMQILERQRHDAVAADEPPGVIDPRRAHGDEHRRLSRKLEPRRAEHDGRECRSSGGERSGEIEAIHTSRSPSPSVSMRQDRIAVWIVLAARRSHR